MIPIEDNLRPQSSDSSHLLCEPASLSYRAGTSPQRPGQLTHEFLGLHLAVVDVRDVPLRSYFDVGSGG